MSLPQEGVAMLSSVLRSEQAVQVNIAIMRAFVRMREVMISHKEIARRLDAMEGKYDAQFKAVFDALRRLMEPPVPPKNGRSAISSMKKTPEEPVPSDARPYGKVGVMIAKRDPGSWRRWPHAADRAAHPSGRHY